MYDITFETDSQSLLKKENRLFESFWNNPADASHQMSCGHRGIFEQTKEESKEILDIQCMSLRDSSKGLFAATSDGVYIYDENIWKSFALGGEYINALSLDDTSLFAVIDKHSIVELDYTGAEIVRHDRVKIDSALLKEDIKLSRFTRDIHYGRGLFDGISSLLINDYSSVVLIFLTLSGYIAWYFIRKKKRAQLVRSIIKIHASLFSIFAIIPLLLLALSGILLDHSKLLGSWMKSVNLENAYLPPVYRSLSEDIWSIDHDKGVYYIGNRYGVYESSDLKQWDFASKGFAYRMKRIDGTLYISGMGAPNRVKVDDNYQMLKKSPHMFKDISIEKEKNIFLAHHSDVQLPEFTSITLYTLLLALHDGTFFASWWVWINDIGAVLLMVILFTGLARYMKRKKII